MTRTDKGNYMSEMQIWTDPLRSGAGRVPSHVPLGAYPDVERARARVASPFCLSLNGLWQFQLSTTPDAMPADFLGPVVDDAAWLDMPVPSNWQLDDRVDDQPIYTNSAYPFVAVPPQVPAVNPTGWYRRSFSVPADWAGRSVFVRFESCDSAAMVYVNGQLVGYSEDSKLPHEFDITAYLVPGDNSIAVMVPRYCTGFWLEDQDYWHLSGIQRDVTLYSKPTVYLHDFVVRTTFDTRYRDAELMVSAHLNPDADPASGFSVRVDLFDPSGAAVFDSAPESAVSLLSPMYGNTDPEYGAARFRLPVSAPQWWTAETPRLYTLVLSLCDHGGAVIDIESCRVGFREIAIRDGVWCLNGRRLVVRGVNAHEHHPTKGRAITREDMRAELLAMKRLNFNAVRTSHYPRHSIFYDLCDEIGMYVVDESNLETHGVGAMISKDPLWLPAMMERAQRMAQRDKNHPCVVAWSLGNESFYGASHAAMAGWLRAYDPTRPVQYESGCPGPAVTDIIAPMYAQLPWVEEMLADPAESRPVVQCEYAYSKGNALGNVFKFWDLVRRLPGYQGGFVWDWADKALVRRVDGEERLAYGNEFDDGVGPDGYNYGAGENPQMVLNGVVGSRLEPKPGAWELKQAQAPAWCSVAHATDARAGIVTVHNDYLALDASHLVLEWCVHAEGRELRAGSVPVPAIVPGATGRIDLPVADVDLDPTCECFLDCRLLQAAATDWSEAGFVVSAQQFTVSGRHQTPVVGTPAAAPKLVTEADGLRVSGADWSWQFDSVRGVLCAAECAGRSVLSAPLEHCFMRARTDNDYILGNGGNYLSGWQENGLDRLHTKVEQVAVCSDEEAVRIHCRTCHRAENAAAAIVADVQYQIDGTGTVSVEVCVDARDVTAATLPRVGMRCALPADFAHLAWYGRGPHESYPDRKHSALFGAYRSSVAAQFHPFLDPCECGGHVDTRWCAVSDGAGVTLRVGGRPAFQFSALPFSMEAIHQASHAYKLEASDATHLHIDGFHLGLGGDTGWTDNVHDEFKLPPGVYRYGFSLDLASTPP